MHKHAAFMSHPIFFLSNIQSILSNFNSKFYELPENTLATRIDFIPLLSLSDLSFTPFSLLYSQWEYTLLSMKVVSFFYPYFSYHSHSPLAIFSFNSTFFASFSPHESDRISNKIDFCWTLSLRFSPHPHLLVNISSLFSPLTKSSSFFLFQSIRSTLVPEWRI